MKNRPKRPRIPAKVLVGQVVASTNPIQYGCCKALVILQKYESLTYKRLSRYVNND
jgi:hypothetical protein